MAPKDVLMIGSSGLLAPHLIRSLSASPQISLTVLTRSKPPSPPKNAHFISLPTPYQAEQLAEILKGKYAIINLVPPGKFDFAFHEIEPDLLRVYTTDIFADGHSHETVIDLCVKEGVKRYIPPDFGLRSDNDTLAEMTPVVAMKKRVREYLQKKEVNGLSWTAVICGCFLDSGLSTGFLGFNIKDRQARLYDDGKVEMDVTLLSDVARAVASVIEQPDETNNRYVYINTLLASQSDILSTLEQQRGGFGVSHVGAAEACAEGTAKLKKGDFSGLRDSLLGALCSGVKDANGEGKDNKLLLGQETRPLADLEGVIRTILKEKDL